MKTLISLTFFLICLPLVMADKFVDRFSTNGLNTGVDWDNAWTNFNAINWATVTAGTTIWVAGGNGRTYGYLNWGKSGTATFPITMRVAQDPERNGRFQMSGINKSRYIHIVIDGGLDPNFVPPIGPYDLWNITNNIGIDIQTTTFGIIGTGTWDDVTIKWLDIGPCGIPNTDDDRAGIWLNPANTGMYLKDVEIAYCWIHHTTKDGINNNGVPASSARINDWDVAEIHHNIISDCADDGIIWGAHGLTFHHNLVGPKRLDMPREGHPDSAQPFNFGKHRLYNNVFYNPKNAWLYSSLTTWTEDQVIGDFHYYGNICYTERDWPLFHSQNYGVHLAGYAGTASSPLTNQHAFFSNAVFLHNTIYYTEDEGLALYNSNTKPYNKLMTMTVTNALYANNLIIDVGFTSENPPIEIKGWSTNDSVIVDYNIVAGPNHKIRRQITYTNAADMAANTSFKSNSNVMPLVVSTNLYDFRLQASDTAARGKGTNLTDLIATMPGLDTDLWGNPRGVDDAWDIGAHSFASEDIVMHLKFADTNGLLAGSAADSSIFSNHGQRFGRYGGTTNFPVYQVVTNNGTASHGATFDYYWDGYGDYGRSGDYAGVTNLNLGTSVSNLTIMLWAKYDAGHTSSGGTSWLQNHSASLIDNGQYGVAGGWRLGRDNFFEGSLYDRRTVWTVWNGADHAQRLQLHFGDFADTAGETPAMIHYAVVFDNGVSTVYTNGVFRASATHTQTTLRLNTQTHWMGVGGWPHHGSVSRDPWLVNGDAYDQYPNTFWFNGQMADVRIYSKSLSAAEVADIYDLSGAPISGDPGDPVDPDPDPEEPDPPDDEPSQFGKIQTLRVTTIRKR